MNVSDLTATDLIEVLDTGRPTWLAANTAGWLSAIRQRAVSKARRSSCRFADEGEAAAAAGVSAAATLRIRGRCPHRCVALSIEELLLDGHAGPRLVFVNGRYAPALSPLGSAVQGDGRR